MVTEEKILQAKSIFKSHLGPDLFNEEGWQYILEHHGGQLPLRIKAVPEGSIIPVKNGVCVCVCVCLPVSVFFCVSVPGVCFALLYMAQRHDTNKHLNLFKVLVLYYLQSTTCKILLVSL